MFPDYKTGVAGRKVGGLGHAVVVTINSKGATRYFEYGRYPQAKGLPPGIARELPVVDVKMGRDGKPTPASTDALMRDLSTKAGQDGRVEGAYFDASDKQTRAMNAAAEKVESQNSDPKKEGYSLTGNNCGTFANDVLEARCVDTPWLLAPRPNSMIGEWQGVGGKVSYDPKEKEKKRHP